MRHTPAAQEDPVAAPGWFEEMLEARAPFELGALLAALPWLPFLPRGDAHAVLVFPRPLGTNPGTRPPRLVVTLGTPFTGKPESSNASRLFEALNDRERQAPAVRAARREPPPVPTTSIYSRTDGVVAWRCSIEPPGRQTKSVAVSASHTGMGVNALVLKLIAQRQGTTP